MKSPHVCARCRDTKQKCGGSFPCEGCQLHSVRLRTVNAVDMCEFPVAEEQAKRTARVLSDVVAACLRQRFRVLEQAERAALRRLLEQEDAAALALEAAARASKEKPRPPTRVRFSKAQIQATPTPTPALLKIYTGDVSAESTDQDLAERGLKRQGEAGTGGHAHLWVVECAADNSKRFALKMCRKPSSAVFLERELFALQIATGMDHVVQLADHQLAKMRVGAWEPRGSLDGILLEHVKHIPFIALPMMAGGWGTRHCLQCALCLLRGVAGLHERGLIHGDIKPANVLVHPEGMRATIADLGLASLADTLPEDGYGTQGSRAPENMRPLAARKKGEDQQLVEVWACGVVILCLLKARESIWTDTELKAKRKFALGRWSGQERELHSIAERAAKEHGSQGEVEKVWMEGVGQCAVPVDSALWRWLALEVMHFEWAPVQGLSEGHNRGRVSAAEAAESWSKLKL